jgi:hypothetical protein
MRKPSFVKFAEEAGIAMGPHPRVEHWAKVNDLNVDQAEERVLDTLESSQRRTGGHATISAVVDALELVTAVHCAELERRQVQAQDEPPSKRHSTDRRRGRR